MRNMRDDKRRYGREQTAISRARSRREKENKNVDKKAVVPPVSSGLHPTTSDFIKMPKRCLVATPTP